MKESEFRTKAMMLQTVLKRINTNTDNDSKEALDYAIELGIRLLILTHLSLLRYNGLGSE